MYGRKKVEKGASGNHEVRLKIEKLLTGKDEYDLVVKDLLLIEGALCADLIIISLDGRAHYHFKKISNEVEQIKPLSWVNLSNDFEGVIQWLQDGAPIREEFQLGYKDEDAK